MFNGKIDQCIHNAVGTKNRKFRVHEQGAGEQVFDCISLKGRVHEIVSRLYAVDDEKLLIILFAFCTVVNESFA